MPQEYSSNESSSSSFCRSLSDEESEDCCGKALGGISLEDTLSLTCDQSSISSSSIVESTIDENSDTEADIYHSPHLLRRRLLPLAPSPIANSEPDSPIHRKPFEDKTLLKQRPTTRIIWFTLFLVVFFLGSPTNYRTVVETLKESTMNEETRQWRRFFRRRAPKILQKLPSKSSNLEYTIRIRGHRVDLVTQSLDFHSGCPSVKEVQVEWNGSQSSNVPPSLMNHRSGKVKPVEKPSTPAVLLLDEDLILPCEEIERAFQEWRLDPSRLVGFYPFHHHSTLDSSTSEFQLRPVSRGGTYSMVSDRAVFVHNLILRSIPTPPKECQHLGMSIIVSSITSKPPVAVLSHPKTFQQSKRRDKEISSQSCQQWVDSLGTAQLPDQIATIVGSQKQL